MCHKWNTVLRTKLCSTCLDDTLLYWDLNKARSARRILFRMGNGLALFHQRGHRNAGYGVYRRNESFCLAVHCCCKTLVALTAPSGMATSEVLIACFQDWALEKSPCPCFTTALHLSIMEPFAQSLRRIQLQFISFLRISLNDVVPNQVFVCIVSDTF